jgi:hypothetical protein
MKLLKSSLVVGILACTVAVTCANATTIDWNTWTSDVAGNMGSVNVGFSAGGSFQQLVPNYPSYMPSTTFADGVFVSNAPVNTDGIIKLIGGNQNINTVTFSTDVIDPVMAIWSLGQGGIQANFTFRDLTPIFVAGGPSSEYNGLPIDVIGNIIYGNEGNGTVRFNGTYSSISWINPVAENWYGFNVGAPLAAPVPEPSTLLLLGGGLAGLAFVVLRRRKE